jgi:predicted Fe-Mo cluster-binding NifX family protein
MKIAAITEDGKTISQHFGRAPYYLVLTLEDGRIVDRDLREKLGHAHFSNKPHEASPPGQPHGTGPAAQSRHARMAQSIADCEALLCGGMGMGAYQSIQERGIRPIVTDLESIDEAAIAYFEGRLVDQTDRLH